MSLPVRNSVRVLLLNEQNELLLMHVDDPNKTDMDGKYRGQYWFTLGGRIEGEESIFEAAKREIYEESGIKSEEIELGPLVWFGEYDLILNGVPTRNRQKFIVAKTKQREVAPVELSDWEQSVFKRLAWFSLEELRDTDEIIYPVLLPEFLPDILSERYHKEPIEIDLAKNPSR